MDSRGRLDGRLLSRSGSRGEEKNLRRPRDPRRGRRYGRRGGPTFLVVRPLPNRRGQVDLGLGDARRDPGSSEVSASAAPPLFVDEPNCPRCRVQDDARDQEASVRVPQQQAGSQPVLDEVRLYPPGIGTGCRMSAAPLGQAVFSADRSSSSVGAVNANAMPGGGLAEPHRRGSRELRSERPSRGARRRAEEVRGCGARSTSAPPARSRPSRPGCAGGPRAGAA